MKRVLWISVLILFISPAWANDTLNNDSNWGVAEPPQTKSTPSETSEKVWEKEQHAQLYENYGSQDSPAFLNREGIDPSTSDLEDKYDYEDDAPYDYENGGN